MVPPELLLTLTIAWSDMSIFPPMLLNFAFVFGPEMLMMDPETLPIVVFVLLIFNIEPTAPE